jgi:DNA ligase (NAD+)
VGGETATLLASHFVDLQYLAEADEARLMNVPGIGPKIAQSIAAFFRQEENRRILDKLKKADVWPKRETRAAGLPLGGMEFVVTGTLQSFSREIAHEKIKALGGSVKDSVTRQTDYLVVGADPGGSKLARAQALGTKQIDEQEFLRLLGE